MAYVKKTGKSFGVFKGNSGKKLSTFKSRKKANSRLKTLHKKNKPKASNRGTTARRKHG